MNLDPRRWKLSRQRARTQGHVYAASAVAAGLAIRTTFHASHVTSEFVLLVGALALSILLSHEGERRRYLFVTDTQLTNLLTTWVVVAVLTLPPVLLMLFITAVGVLQQWTLPKGATFALHKAIYTASTQMIAGLVAAMLVSASAWLAALVYFAFQRFLIGSVMRSEGAPWRILLDPRIHGPELVLCFTGVAISPLAMRPALVFALIVFTAITQQAAQFMAVASACARDGLVRDRAWVHMADTLVSTIPGTALVVFATGRDREAATIIAKEIRTGDDWITIRPEGVHLVLRGVGAESIQRITRRHMRNLLDADIHTTVGWATSPDEGVTLDELNINALCLLGAHRAVHATRVAV